jgi:hypothetical protein
MAPWLVALLVPFWPGPIGLGFFLAGLGIYYWGLAHCRQSKME